MSSQLLVKICGITRLEDGLGAARRGADWLGFNFWPGSRRYIRPEAAAPIVAALPAHVVPVGVFVDPIQEELEAAVEISGVRVVQLHGDESPEFCAAISVPVVKGVRVRGPQDLAALAVYQVSAFLLDSATPGFGGSGTCFDWSLAAEAACSVPLWLAGGLTVENVAEAVRRVRPKGVDVASGVEAAPGLKDLARVRAFIRNAKTASEP